MKAFLKAVYSLIGLIYSIYALIWAIGLILALFPFAVLFLFIKKPGGTTLFYSVCRGFARLWFMVTAIRYEEIQLGSEGLNGKEPYIYIANHRSYIDIFMMLASMRGPYRPFGKEEMAKIPFFGFFYRKFVVTVNRRELLSRSKSFIELKKTIHQKISVFIFPEGTFNETEQPLKSFYNGPFQLALKTGTKIKPVVFLDNLQRMHFSSVFSIRPGVCRVVFLEGIDAENYPEGSHADLKRDTYTKMYQALTKYNAYYAKFR